MSTPEPVDITPKKDGGVLKTIKKEGTGTAKPTAGTTVKVHYVGTLENGEKFDSSRDRASEFSFLLGREQVIKGWDLGVATMKRGEIADFKIRSDYGYGESGSMPKIPPNATLNFEVELIDWQAEDISPNRDGTITRSVIVEGEKLANPNDTSPVEVHAVGTYEGKVFFDKDVNFVLGEGSEVGLPEGVDRALRRFCRGEKSIIKLSGTKFTYGPNPPPEYNLPPNATIEFTIFLKSFEKVPATWEMTSEKKIEEATLAKDRGTAFLRQNKLKLAFNKYKRIEDILEYEKSMDPAQKKARDDLILAAYLNLSLTASKMGEHLDCIKYCDKALEQSPNNVKALYRKAGARLAMSDLEEAKQIYEKVLEIDPENKAAAQQILVVRQMMREQNERDKKRYKNLFSKISDEPKTEKPNPFQEEKKGDEPQLVDA
ncbi:unnamed protein product [Cylicocyclus nassatus]|uniref:peptidylprolyl isomerase n=1 Tax=Cylicocyclus nassatus TaxID=53992 RepID=A0AA36DMF4_CYLNA|nr:unnamed protein product [Cylicocyclus nassatus]